ncbi:thiamine-phosphate kinase [Nitrincola alkalisediminis]|uniref:thiamine-phosphate kinase n=1 Tax=Nitrincola alkalisediminis TaxID=1366656 RepID=UPI00187471B6|nr:thiamine-phosphate kinase [Nitrincola alkalisediminis]
MGEFDLIRRYFARESLSDPSVYLGIGDDCALLCPPAGQLLAVSIDTLVEGVHFLPGTPGDKVASRLLCAAVSDLAAMAATPAWFTLALSMPSFDQDWLEPFAACLAETARGLGIQLVGGDTTRGPLTLSVQVHGFVEPDLALKRSGAQVGDIIAVTGYLGESKGGLESLLKNEPDTSSIAHLRQRFYAPTPRVELARALAPFAHSAIDISDGFLADLKHILDASQVGARIDTDAILLSQELLAFAGSPALARQWALTGGEDFELCLTLPSEHWAQCQRTAQALSIPLTCVGVITETPALTVYENGHQVHYTHDGYDHFRSSNG